MNIHSALYIDDIPTFINDFLNYKPAEGKNKPSLKVLLIDIIAQRKNFSKIDPELLLILLIKQSNINPVFLDDLLFRESASCGWLNAVSYLLEFKGTGVMAVNNQAIIEASKNGHIDIVRVLMESKKITQFRIDDNPLSTAFLNNHINICQLLLQYKVTQDLFYNKFFQYKKDITTAINLLDLSKKIQEF